MKQHAIIKTMAEKIFPNCRGIKAALLIGSFARGKVTSRSDIDFSLWVDKDDFETDDFIMQLKQGLSSIKNILYVHLREKIIVYFSDCPKMELLISTEIDNLDKHFLGSEIYNKKKSIVFAKDDIVKELESHLDTIISNKKQKLTISKRQLVRDLVDKFIYEFENASNMHKRSDSYQFYFDYNIALNVAVQLRHIAFGKTEFYFAPKNIANNFENKERELFLELACSLYLPEANKKKRKLLDFFYNAFEQCGCHSEMEIVEIKSFLEDVYRRDYFWNFRDLSMLCKKCKPGIIFRSSSFTRYQDSDAFNIVLEKYKITTIIDLRDSKEKQDKPYDMKLLEKNKIGYRQIPLDISRPSNFASEFPNYTDEEKEYRWFALGNKEFYKKFYTEIDLSKEVILIHCHAGKDRTGIVCALIGLLLGESDEIIENEYLESEMDSNVKNIQAFLSTIKEFGGAEKFLLSCGVSEQKIEQWKSVIKNN